MEKAQSSPEQRTEAVDLGIDETEPISLKSPTVNVLSWPGS
jgi:hypothetical protein